MSKKLAKEQVKEQAKELDITQAEEADHIMTKRGEFVVLLFMGLVVAPLAAIGFVVTYGFIIWMLQLIGGPPAA